MTRYKDHMGSTDYKTCQYMTRYMDHMGSTDYKTCQYMTRYMDHMGSVLYLLNTEEFEGIFCQTKIGLFSTL